jgi:GR25 family glycosyltransferase involved in LPS biosynthesis
MKVNEYFDKVVVINLDRRKDRLEKVDAQLQELGITYERFSAIDAKALDIDPIQACRQSHIQVLEESVGKTLILEDDACFMEGFNERFTEFVELLPKDWHIFYLGAVLLNSERCNDIMVRAMDTSSLHAYCVNPEFKEIALKQGREYPEHIDVAYRLLHRQYRSYAAKPPMVKQYPSYSDLMLEDVDYMSWYK